MAVSQGTTSQATDKLVEVGVLKGHDFSRANNANKMDWASAPEGQSFSVLSRIGPSFRRPTRRIRLTAPVRPSAFSV
jgi:hypothetical protein